MSNHVPIVFRLFDTNEVSSLKYLEEVMYSIKRFAAQKYNESLGQSGQFWQYERLVRND
jgi:hypothetical protein